MATATRESVQQSFERPSAFLKDAPLLVATDGSAGADAALRAAREIAARTGQRVRLLAVHEPLPMTTTEVQLANTPDMETAARDTLRLQVEEQRDRLRADAEWPLEVASGDVAATIVNAARDAGAGVIIMGLGGHGMFDRILGDEYVLKVLRIGTLPVLAVAPGFAGLPRRVLAAMDFSASSVRALSLGAELLRPRGRLTIAHVVASDEAPLKPSQRSAGYYGPVGRALDRVVGEIGFGDTSVLERMVVVGDAAKELLRISDDVQPDLIVTGSHGHNFLSRLLLGSVSTRIVRGASCSVLVVPPLDAPGFLDELPANTDVFGFYEWAERLEEFTRRNVGRRATLEVVATESGAQLQADRQPFISAAFDPRAARVLITLGFDPERSWINRVISGVTAIQSLRDRSGRDLMLRVAHAGGQTLLTLER